MKNLLYIIVFIASFGSLTQAQEATVEYHKRAVGFDVSAISNLIPLEANIGIPSDYFFEYRKYKSPLSFNRMSLDIGVFSNLQEGTNAPNNKSTEVNVNLRFGKGKKYPIVSSLFIVYGYDVLLDLGYDHLSSNSTSSQSLGFEMNGYGFGTGGGVFGGIQWDITKRITLLTEGNAYLRFSSLFSSQKFEEPSIEDENNNTFNLATSIKFPGNIKLLYHF